MRPDLIQIALSEDNPSGDITTDTIVAKDSVSTAEIICKEAAVICGLNLLKPVFKKLDPGIKLRFFARDGGSAVKNQTVARLRGKTRALLTGERVALNFLSFLSGIATITRKYVEQVKPYGAEIFDTRKTIPGLRELSKWAVRCGGGRNHRMHLSEMVMLKDNHRFVSRTERTLAETVSFLRKKTGIRIEVEVDDLKELRDALGASPDIVLLDNMKPRQMQEAIRIVKKMKKHCLVEASGGITLRNVRAVARTGVDRISIGALTHSVKGIDFSMEFTAPSKSKK